MDKFNGILLVAGFGCFIFAFLLSGLYPIIITDATNEASIAELATVILPDYEDLRDGWPVAFESGFPRAEETLSTVGLRKLEQRLRKEVAAGGLSQAQMDEQVAAAKAKSDEAWPVAMAAALQRGRDIYISEACWHCHSQYVRPVANEDMRYGPVSTIAQDNNALQRPMLWGTRRVGPDLTYEGGKRSNDWHAAHLHDPRSTSPKSVMPKYPWYFREGFQVYRRVSERAADLGGLDPETAYPYPGIYDSKADAEAAMARLAAELAKDQDLAPEAERLFVGEGIGPNADGLALISYLQWLGTWRPEDTRKEAKE
ncbi:MAG: cbb3-type cytochrome c oxidase subunit II [Planctomycetes bacterium]|nr:cbb3-type cytochrome c oxidase subunit II [Planctomycetota bacterium]